MAAIAFPINPAARALVAPLPVVCIDDMILSDSARAQLDRIMRELKHRAGLLARGIPPRSRLLFYGPPGNGKSATAAAIAATVDVNGYVAKLDELIAPHLGETGERLGKLFTVLEGGSLLVVDEIDSMGTSRIGGNTSAAKEQNSIVNVLLTLMDRVGTGILVATTNRRDLLDPALRRRFDIELEFTGPDEEGATALATRLCAKYGIPTRIPATRESYDAIAKAVLDDAREIALADLERWGDPSTQEPRPQPSEQPKAARPARRAGRQLTIGDLSDGQD